MSKFRRATKRDTLLPFFENRKKCPDFAEKGPDSVHLWVKYSIQTVVLRVSGRKKSKIFTAGPYFLLRFWQNFYRRALTPQNLPCPEKFLAVRLKFEENSHLSLVHIGEIKLFAQKWENYSAEIIFSETLVLQSLTFIFVILTFQQLKKCNSRNYKIFLKWIHQVKRFCYSLLVFS